VSPYLKEVLPSWAAPRGAKKAKIMIEKNFILIKRTPMKNEEK
jgi:hypothetical protein